MLTKILTNRIQHLIKRIIYNDKVIFTAGMQGFFNQYTYSENYETLMKVIKEDKNHIYHVLEWKSQYNENKLTTQSNLQIQCNSCQITNDTLYRIRIKTLQFVCVCVCVCVSVCLCVCQSLSHTQLFATQWTVAHQILLSMGFSRHRYWSGLVFPSPGDLPDPGIEAGSPALQADSLPIEPLGKPIICMETQNTQKQQWNFEGKK